MSSFDRLSPFIKEYIFSEGWSSLRPVQEEAARVLFDTKDNLLLSCGTSAGKTEAAFFPILTMLAGKSSSSCDVLYIAPLKALINDQYERMTYLCARSGIKVWRRHGDVSARNKDEFFESPCGILQTTPESLEGILIGRPEDVPRVFGGTKYIVIDELHALLCSDRGGQVLCQVSRLMRKAHIKPRIVGLSATIGNPALTCGLLTKCNGRNTVCPKIPGDKLEASLLYEYFEDEKARDEYVYEAVRKKNSLVFSNSRDETESITASLRDISEKRCDSGDVLIHHGNISATLRHDAEKALRTSGRHTVVCATSTLELGIDIGKLERVVSLGTPNTVSSFLQRLGRSGRRGNIPEMLSVFCSEKDEGGEILPFALLQGIAMTELYRREKFVEPPLGKKYPYSLLCHQTISELLGSPEGLTLPELARNILTLAPFLQIPKDDYKKILSGLYASDYIQKTSDGKLIAGNACEKICADYRFYAVFREEQSYTVIDENGKEIGTIPENVPVGGRFTLAGRAWVCERVDAETRHIFARAAKGRLSSYWHGSLTGIDDKVAEYASKILSEDEIYPYLGRNAARVLTEARKLSRDNGFTERPLHRISEDEYIILPWFGSRAMNTLCRYIRYFTGGSITSRASIDNPYLLSFRMDGRDEENFRAVMKEGLFASEDLGTLLTKDNESCFTEKYDYLVPRELLKKAYAADRMETEKVERLIERL